MGLISDIYIQGFSASQSLGFKDLVLESSEWQSAASLVSYCPSRSSELEETATTKHSDRLAEIRCIGQGYLTYKGVGQRGLFTSLNLKILEFPKTCPGPSYHNL